MKKLFNKLFKTLFGLFIMASSQASALNIKFSKELKIDANAMLDWKKINEKIRNSFLDSRADINLRGSFRS